MSGVGMRNPRRLARYSLVRKVTGRSSLARRAVLRDAERDQWRFVSTVLDNAQLMRAIADGDALPSGYAPDCTERVVEYPWALSRLHGRVVLDAGSTFNHRPLIDRLAHVDLTIATLEPEPHAFTQERVSYLYADLRDLPLRSGVADTVLCVSVLEHVGMDNAVYGAAGERATDPGTEARLALDELRRVCRPGGRILLTVPYGRAMDMGWQRQFGPADVDHLLEGVLARTTVFKRGTTGWQRSDVRSAAECEYATGASAVLCAEISC